MGSLDQVSPVFPETLAEIRKMREETSSVKDELGEAKREISNMKKEARIIGGSIIIIAFLTLVLSAVVLLR
jgi:hypothetical protein